MAGVVVCVVAGVADVVVVVGVGVAVVGVVGCCWRAYLLGDILRMVELQQ